MVSLHILQVGMNELTPVIYKLSLMEYGTASNLSPARQNHIIDPGSSTDASNKIICVVYQAWSFLRSSSGLHYKYCKFFLFSCLCTPFPSSYSKNTNPLVVKCLKHVKQRRLVSSMVLMLCKHKPTH